jgi:cell division septation protein DedD
MEEQTTWKGHSLTLLVFGGIVVLCSIFFILGMLVGRQQGQKFASIAATAEAATPKPEAKPAPLEDEKPELTFFDSVEKEKASPALEHPPEAKPAPPEPAKHAEPQTPADSINFQVGAVKKSRDADKLLGEVKKKGFKAFIIAPPPGDANPFFRVQVGPFSDVIEAESARKGLEAAGYKPILKK